MMLEWTHVAPLDHQGMEGASRADVTCELVSCQTVVFQVNSTQVAVAFLLQYLIAFLQPNCHDRQP